MSTGAAAQLAIPRVPAAPSPSRSSISPTRHQQQRYSLDSVDWDAIRSDAEEPASEVLFYLVASASFLEGTADRYTANLIDQFRGDDEITRWLEHHWLPEEMRHGRTLRRYVQTAWPDFPWERAYDAFLGEFAAHCCPDELEPTRTREMASRCVVEAGTAAYYTTLSRISRDPVLASIAARIAEEEVRHYKHFYRFFCRYQHSERAGRRAVAHAEFNRLRMIGGQDGVIAVKHVYCARHPGEVFDARTYRRLRAATRLVTRAHFPYRMCVQMLLKPLGLAPRARRIVVPMAEMLARRISP